MQERFTLPLAIYTILVLLIGSNIFGQPNLHTLGWLSTDAMDTMSLRWLFFNPEARFAPVGYDFAQLTPNILDHLLAYPLVSFLGFPLGDNLWWFFILLANAFSAHALGKRLGGEIGGYWTGILVLSSEQLLREVNLYHAPQSMLFFPLLYCWSLLQETSRRNSILTGILLGLAGCCYLYSSLFVLIGMLPLLWRKTPKDILLILGVATITLLPNLGWLVWMTPELINTPIIGQIQGVSMQEIHSGSWDLLWQNQPLDLSNQMSFLALGLCGWMFWKRRNPLLWKTSLFCFGFGFLMVLGSNIPIFEWLHKLPILSRLTWSERWGLLLLLGVIFGSAPFFQHKHRLIWRLPPILLLEMFLRSGNLPLHAEPIDSYQCYAELAKGKGVILELPLQKNDPLFNRSALYQRLHLRPMINPFQLPPMASPPEKWETWKEASWLKKLDSLDHTETIDPSYLQELGITTIIIDRSTFSPISDREAVLWREHLERNFGTTTDLGCLWLWSLDAKQKWGSEDDLPKILHPAIDFPLLMEPINQK
jgi:hypothetical protein